MKSKWIKDRFGNHTLEGTEYSLERTAKSYGVVYRILKNGEYIGIGNGVSEAKQIVKDIIEGVN